MERGPIAEIDLAAVAHNLRTAKRLTNNRTVIAVVKADAYGHGAVEVSRRLVKEGIRYLAVAYTAEAVTLRQAGIRAPVIVLFDKHDLQDYFRYNLIPVIHDLKTARAFSKEANKKRVNINVHIKVDTGMGRMGFNTSGMEKNILSIANMDSLTIAGLMSHFSDADLSDRSYAIMQLNIFNNLRNSLIKKGIKPDICHMANSAATLSLPESHLDSVRPGLMLYGYSPLAAEQGPRGQGAKGPSIKIRQTLEPSNPRTLESLLRPVMTVKTNILALRKFKKGTPVSYGRTFITARESLIAVLPLGYADGYSRALSNNSNVLIRGKRSPVAGRVCMDTIMVDVTDVRGAAEGDEVILIGKQKDNVITASELALNAGTISYETLTSLGNKSRRIYIK